MAQLGFLGIDQHGQHWKLEGKHPRKALLDKLASTHADKMWVDTKDGRAKHIGYVVGGLWVTLYEVHEWVGRG